MARLRWNTGEQSEIPYHCVNRGDSTTSPQGQGKQHRRVCTNHSSSDMFVVQEDARDFFFTCWALTTTSAMFSLCRVQVREQFVMCGEKLYLSALSSC